MKRRGTLMLLLLLALAFGGIVAMRLVPEVVIQQERAGQENLKDTLSRFRQAFDLKRRYEPDFPPLGISATQALSLLVSSRLLSASDTTDPSIPAHQWNRGSNTWRLSDNIAQHTSFEAEDKSSDPNTLIASWVKSQEVSWGLATSFYPSRSFTGLDDYPGQNRLGQVLESSGSSLMVVK